MNNESIIQAMLDSRKAVRTDTMSYEDWLVLRRDSIGGSDAGPIMLLSDYSSPLMVYLQKKGADSAEMSPAAKRGKLLEPVVRDWFAEAHPELIITKVPYMFYSGTHPFMSANLDGLIATEGPVEIQGKTLQGTGGLEIKSSKYGYHFSEDEIPDAYYAQIQHYMTVMDLSWFVLSVCFLDTEEIRNYSILRNDEFIENLITEEKHFWEEFVIPSVMPAAIGIENEDDMITGMFNGSASTLNLTEEEKELCRKINEVKQKLKPLEEQEKALKTDLKAGLIARAEPSEKELKLSAIGGPFSVSWTFFERHSVDTEALKKAGLYEQFLKVSKSDRMTVSLKKGA
jgi:putative phage-type endonuclease